MESQNKKIKERTFTILINNCLLFNDVNKIVASLSELNYVCTLSDNGALVFNKG